MPENIVHFGGIRIRVNGSGNLKPTLYSLDKIRSSILVPLVMVANTDIEPTRLCNFTSQRAILRLETTEFNDVMRVNRIIVYVKPMYTQFPG